MAAKKAFVHDCCAFVPGVIGSALKAAGYEVTGTVETRARHDWPSWVDTAVRWKDEEKYADAVLASDVLVFHLPGHEKRARSTVQAILAAEATSEKTIVVVSTVFTWARTRAHILEGGEVGWLAAADQEARLPAPRARAASEAERTVLRSARKGRLNTFVICPGVLYGAGETTPGLHDLFRAAWECKEGGVPLYGEGANLVPTTHVSDVASTALALFNGSRPNGDPKGQYIICVDEPASTLREITEAIAKSAGNGQIAEVPKDELRMKPGLEALVVNLKFKATALDPAPELQYAADGLVARAADVVAEYKAARNFGHLGVVLVGPPCAGKSTLGQALAWKYSVPYITPEAIAAAHEEIPEDDEEEGAFRAEVAKIVEGGQLPNDEQMLKLAWRVLDKMPEKNKGYVMDGWPRTEEQARALLVREVPPEPVEEEAPAEGEGEGGEGSEGASDKGEKEKKAESPPPPRRSSAGGKADAKGKDAKGEEEEEAEAEPVFALDKFMAPTHVLIMKAAEDEETEDTLLKERILCLPEEEQVGKLTVAAFTAAMAEYRADRLKDVPPEPEAPPPPDIKEGEEPPTPPPDPEPLPPIGLTGFYLESGAALLDLDCAPAADDVLAATLALLGLPHNYVGWGEPPATDEVVEETEEEREAREAAEAAAAAEAALKARRAELDAAADAEEAEIEAGRIKGRAGPLKYYLMNDIMPHVTAGMLDLCKTRPEDPVTTLAQFLISKADEIEAAQDAKDSEARAAQAREVLGDAAPAAGA